MKSLNSCELSMCNGLLDGCIYTDWGWGEDFWVLALGHAVRVLY